MKPRLIKFTCPACNARLAVPSAMEGMEDNCPKCSARITAPVPAAEPAAPVDPPPTPSTGVALEKSSQTKLDAVLKSPEPVVKEKRSSKTRENANAPAERDAYRSTLFDEFLSTPPTPIKEEIATSSLAPSDVLSESFQKSKPLKEANPAPEAELKEPPPATPATVQAPESFVTAAPESRTLLEIISAAPPKPVAPPLKISDEPPATTPTWDSPPPHHAPVPFVEDPISEHSVSPTPSGIRHVLPSLGVGLMQVEDTPRHHRRLRRRRVTVMGILLFLLFDALIFFWVFRHRISEWWNDPNTTAVVQTVAAPTSTDQPKNPPAVLPVAIPVEKTSPSVTHADDKLEKINPAVTASQPNPAGTANTLTQIDLLTISPAAPSIVSVFDNPITDNLREVSNITGKSDGLVPPITITTPPMTQTLPTPADLPAPPATNNVTAKTEITPPPLPPPLTSSVEPPDNPAIAVPAPDVPVPDVGETPSTSTKIIEKGITKSSRPALEALKFFLAAPTWQYRLRWVQKPDVVKAAMEKHYRKYPDGPIDVARIDFIERYPAKSKTPPYCMFEVSGGDLKRNTLVLVEEKSKDENLVDWEAFVEFKDQLLWEFLIKPSSPPGKFRVMLRRKHYFDKDIPDIERKEAFELSQPGADTTVNVFAVKGGSAAKVLAQQLAWGDGIAVTVQLVWHDEGTRGWVEVKTVPAFGWRG